MDDRRFTKEALKMQDGKKVPVRLGTDGPIIGEATLRYDPETRGLMSDIEIFDPKVVETFLTGDVSAIFNKES